MNRHKLYTLFVTAILAVVALSVSGCQTSGYEQSAGATAKWPDRPETGKAKDEPHGAHVRYEFDPVTGNVTSVDVNVTNATEMALIDESLIRSKSAVSKSSIAAAGSRDGMLDNNTQVNGEAKTASEIAAVLRELKGIVKDLKAPVTLPTKE